MKAASLLALCVLSLAIAPMGAQEDARPVVVETTTSNEPSTDPALPTLWIVGDSTVKNNGEMRGWGQEIGTFFDRSRINVVNRAIGGRSSRTFIAEGRWDAVLREMKAGDFLLVQFGHNDGGPLDEKGKFRGSLKGEGDETQDVTKSDGTVETVRSFGWYMRKYGADAKATGVTAIFCSPVPHKNWRDGRVVRNTIYANWSSNAAKSSGGFFINLNEIAAGGYEELGPEKVEAFFADARTHTNAEGARFNARAVMSGLKSLPDVGLGKFLSPEADDIVPFVSQP